jgi:dihydrofolate reductase
MDSSGTKGLTVLRARCMMGADDTLSSSTSDPEEGPGYCYRMLGSGSTPRKERDPMSKLKLNITMSLDGFVAGPDQSETDPLGIGGMQLHEWILSLDAFTETHGGEGHEVNASTPFAEEILAGTGATIMGRNMFGGGPGPWGDDPWKGYWGDDPPYHHPVFVLTRHPREPLEMEGGTTFHFVTDGIEAALEQAKDAAGGKDVSIGGGANVVQQYLGAGLLDEMVISIVPILLGAGARLFDNLGEPAPELRQVQAVEAPGVTHIRYTRVEE